MTARDDILAKVRVALGSTDPNPARRAAVEQRLARPVRHPVPARTVGKDTTALCAMLRGYLEGQSATVVELAGMAGVPGAIANYLSANTLPARLRKGADPALAALPWHDAPTLVVADGQPADADPVGLSLAMAAVAETGTLVLASGPDNPVTLGFRPETHIIVAQRETVVGTYEDAWAILRRRYGPHTLPRTVNLISGPSRTGDIGGILVTGAHGPKRLLVLVVG